VLQDPGQFDTMDNGARRYLNNAEGYEREQEEAPI
jgi:hypothetical protein